MEKKIELETRWRPMETYWRLMETYADSILDLQKKLKKVLG